uniref:UDP-glucose 4-epimerase n=1 Tax=Trichobilharzia regenti TaxID=157069 RepID=A0AA85KFE4_TRIRE|nr:unnamed protein product [Trichobilharzia regenti]
MSMVDKGLVLVTGGSGFIGSHTIVELINDGYDVITLDNLSNSNQNCIQRIELITGKKLPFYKVNLLDKETLNDIFEKHKVDYVIHFAALKSVSESTEQPLQYYENNVVGLLNLLRVMESHHVKNIVFSSSATVYGEPQFLPLTEKHPIGNCQNPYGGTKFCCEVILKDLYESDHSWNIISLRYFNPVGAHSSGLIGEDPNGIPNNLMPYVTQVASGLRPTVNVYGNDYPTVDGTGVRDYIHIVDLAVAHTMSLNKIKQNCGLKIYNLGTGEGHSVLEMIHAMEKASSKKIPYIFCPRRPGDCASVYSDASLALQELGWKSKYGIDKMCEDMWNWQVKNPQGYLTLMHSSDK